MSRKLKNIFIISIIIFGLYLSSNNILAEDTVTVEIIPDSPKPESEIEIKAFIDIDGIEHVYIIIQECDINTGICYERQNISLNKIDDNTYKASYKLKESKATMIIGIASYIHRLTRVAKKSLDLKNFEIKGIILSAEPWPEAVREEIQEAWGCKAYSQYGTAEMGLAVSLECDARDGLHLNDADFFVECIDPETGEQLRSGEEGELVFTTLSRRGMPLIRYRSYDISWLIDETCGCGANTIQKMGKVKGRLDMQHKIGYGKKIYPLLFDEGLVKIPNIINWQVVIEEVEAKDKLTIKVEAIETPSEEELKNKITEELMKIEEITESLARDAITKLKIEILKPGTLKTTHKSKSIIDSRKTYEE